MFGLNNTEKFKEQHFVVIAREFHMLKNKYPELFSQISDISKVDLYWNLSFNIQNGILGCFRWYAPDRIEISDIFRYRMPGKEEPDISMKMIMPTICHELHHRYQLSTCPVRYFIGLLLRRLIEKSADRIEKEIEQTMKQEFS